MSKKAQKALEASIRHWKRMASGKRRKMKFNNGEMELEEPCADCCDLCRIYLPTMCGGCIVCKDGYSGCNDSPFEIAYELFGQKGANSPEFKEAAQKEVEFLEMLKDKYYGDEK
jgi:hypothetical protein